MRARFLEALGLPLVSHLGAFWKPWAHFWLQGGAPGWFWRGLKKRSKKEVLRMNARTITKGGVPIGIDLGRALDLGLGLGSRSRSRHGA